MDLDDEKKELLEGAYAIGSDRTIGLETLLTTSHVVAWLNTTGLNSLPDDKVHSLSSLFKGGVFHDAEIEFQLDINTCTPEEKRTELRRCLQALTDELRRINHQKDV